MTEEGGVAVGVRGLRVDQVSHRDPAEERREHRADALHGDVLVAQPVLQRGRRLLEASVDVGIAEPSKDGDRAAVASGFPESVPA